MKLQTNSFGFEGNLPENRMGAKIKTSAKLFDVLSSGIYTDPVLAPIRELSCNAYDAHVAAGHPELPFVITVPNYLEPTFAVEDFGTGIPPEQFSDIFYTYGNSTKTDSDEMIGALGLGSKSPFAYTKSSYLVRNRYNGREYNYFCFINEGGEPDGSLVGEVDTDQPNGVKVEFAVKTSDIYTFIARLQTFYKYWQGTMPKFTSDLKVVKPKPVLVGSNWYLEDWDNGARLQATAMMGNVPYKIEAAAIPNLSESLRLIAINPFVITVPMGSLNFTASREGLKYDEATSKAVKDQLAKVRADIVLSFEKEIFAAKNHMEFIKLFGETFRKFVKVFATEVSTGDNELNVYAELLLNKDAEDTIEFKGHKFQITQLAKSSFSFRTEGHECFELIKADTRGKNTKLWLNQSTGVTYVALADIKAGVLVSPDNAQSDVNVYDPNTVYVHKGHESSFAWRDPLSIRKKKKQYIDNVLENHELFDIYTTHAVKINVEAPVTFVINDVGASGTARYKLLSHTTMNAVLVRFNEKNTTLAEARAGLEALVAMCLTGAKIILLSSMPDNRPTIQKVKPLTGTMKLKTTKLHLGASTFNVSLSNFDTQIKTKKYIHRNKTTFTDGIHNIDDLVAAPILYVVKRRSATAMYESPNSQQPSIINNGGVLSIAAHLGFFDDYIDADGSSAYIPVYVLTEGQVAWLAKRNVKMQTIKALIHEKIIALEKAEGFINEIKKVETYSTIDILQQLNQVIPKKVVEDIEAKTIKTVFEEHLLEYRAMKKAAASDVFKEHVAKYHLYDMITDSVIVTNQQTKKINDEILKTYPMLRFATISPSSIGTVMEYIAEK